MKTQQKRRISTAVAAAIAAGWLVAGLPSQGVAQSSAPNFNDPNEIRWVKGRILVQPRAGLSVQELDKKLKTHGGRRVGVIQQINVHIVELPAQASERAVAQMLGADQHINFAELDAALPAALDPNDPSYATAWHLPNIGAPAAWDYSTGEGVTIAILDTGIDAAHPDLAANLVAGYNAYDNNSDTRDVHGHGTKAAGSAAMAGNNLIGGAGVSFKSKIMPVRVADENAYAYYSTMAMGLTWAADHGAKVANMSYWGVCSSSTISTAVGSAGNSGGAVAWTANDAVTCVAATDSSDSRASFSSYGEFVDVAAPGVGIYTTTRGGGYGSVSGTSFSAPVTAAVYALMMAANRSATPSQLDSALFSTARDLGAAGKDPYYGYGRVDAAAAVAKIRGTASADTTAPSVSSDTFAPSVTISNPQSGSVVNGATMVSVSASDDQKVSKISLKINGKEVALSYGTTLSYSWDPYTGKGKGRGQGNKSDSSGTYSISATATDAAGNSKTASVSVVVP
jgi:thermitase